MDQLPVDQPRPPRVTALIVSRNCAQQLQRCLEALERSTERDRLEILVVDNGSSDGSGDVPANFPEVQSLRLPKDFGRTMATNIGVRTAKGDSILFLPAHVEVEPDTVMALAERLESSDSIGAVCPFVPEWFPLPDVAGLREACASGRLPDAQRTREDAAEVAVAYAPGAPILVRRLFVRGMNYFDEQYGDHWWDLELAYQLRSGGKTVLALPQVRVKYGDAPQRESDAVHRADCVLGAAAYAGKHFGTGAAMKLRLGAALGALGKAEFSQLSAIVSGQKVDGTHTG